MRPPLRRAAAVCTLVIGLWWGAAPAHAETGGLGVAVADGPAGMVARLTNGASAPCQVAAGGLGAVSLTSVMQDGQQVAPLGGPTATTEDFGYYLRQTLRVLGPGESVDVPLPTVDWDGGRAVETVLWTRAGGTFGRLYPLKNGSAAQLAAVYVAPDLAVTGAPLCVAATAPVGAAAIAADPKAGFPRLLVIAGAALLLAALLVVLLVRRRRRPGAAAVVLLLLAGAVVVSWPPSGAHAFVVPDKSLENDWAECRTYFQQPGHDPMGIMPTILAPDFKVELRRVSPAPNDPLPTRTDAISPNWVLLMWDPNDHHKFVGKGGEANKCSSLYHELFHAYEHHKRTFSYHQCVTKEEGATGLSIAEVRATLAENKFRKIHNDPERDHYGDIPLPKGECLPPPEPGCTDPARLKEIHNADFVAGLPATSVLAKACALTSGDPHLLTFDGTRYDFQGAGEFVLARDGTGAYEIQVRQEPWGGQRIVTINTALAMRVGGNVVELRADPGRAVTLLVDGTAQPMRTFTLPGGGRFVVDLGAKRHVVWPDGSVLTVDTYGGQQLTVEVQPASTLFGKLEGLLGDFDGDPADDVRPRGGDPLAVPPAFADLYPRLADSWRVDAATSLFTYAPGLGTQSYTDRTVPQRPVDAADLPGRAAAETLCRAYGVADAPVLAACVLDVALTGQPEYAAAAVHSQGVGGGPGGIGATVARPGDTARVQFPARAGQRVFVDVTTTLPDQCTPLRLLDPQDKVLRTGCVAGGRGYLDATDLPADGTYTVLVDPADRPGDVGDVTVTVIELADQHGTITVGGPGVVARIDQPGKTAEFTFTGGAGDTVTLELSEVSLPDECNNVALYGPDGVLLAYACTLGGSGATKPVTLPSAGTYRVVVDPVDRHVGTAVLRLVK
ncbi:hypothetical protein Cs7R123_12750 [Catellatospora sp. TT07R-123]|uniref:VWD domain-containing protein n=1 Tax=Catellatospora sp. TT07R-123 TaxID=2733863 RepID=UPI001B25F233|nr:VWD domain-containing protein [Catellatospora sp. TT07R-123]GHJ43933.1 hypothetical protein Cs7R123_12750 [Catellatospora sp. TT07R-123]